MRILLAGASGFLGTALRRHLAEGGHELVRLVRSEPYGAGEFRWDPKGGQLPPEALDGVGAVVNLAGAPIAHWPWTSSYRRELLESRTSTTGTIAAAIAGLSTPPVLVNASAVGFYGADRGDEDLTEESRSGDGFLAEVVRQWEAATEPASAAGARVVRVRTAIVLDGGGGALKVMKLPFRLGVGGRLGSGRQWFPSISLEDYVAVLARAVTDDQMSGAYNAAAPVPATNADLTRALARHVHRPAIFPVPATVLRALLGELSAQLLGSVKVVPQRLLEAGFEFAHPDIDAQVRAALK